MLSLWGFTGRTWRPRTISSSRHGPRYLSFNRILDPSSLDVLHDYKNYAKNTKWDELVTSLSREHSSPSRVWNVYLELGSIMGFDDVPFAIQQQVLRKCVPHTNTLRVAAARRMQSKNQPLSPHLYESRLKTIISHMRANGQHPTLDDYHFVLKQFVAVGHMTSARAVFREILKYGIEPEFLTYGLCLQAIAHRLTLPCPFDMVDTMRHHAGSFCIQLLDDMWARRIPMNNVNFDLAHRIFKETEDRETFDKMLQVAYGVDLSNPDRPALEPPSPQRIMGESDISYDPSRNLPFSTSALNTLIHMLGNTLQISRMVVAFEVLTEPLPQLPSTNTFTEDEEDDDPAFYQFSPPDDNPHQLPSAMPNTTTYNLLIQYTSKAKHFVFARHYIVQALERDKEMDTQLRVDLAHKPIAEISRPNFSLNRNTFRPLFGAAHRDNRAALLRWVSEKTILAYKRKEASLKFYTHWRDEHMSPSQTQNLEQDEVDGDNLLVDLDSSTELDPSIQSDPSTPSDSSAPSHANTSTSDSSTPVASTSPESSTPSVVPSSSVTDSNEIPTSSPAVRQIPVVPTISDVLEVDLEPPPAAERPPRMLDLDLHIKLLKRDAEELRELTLRIAAVKRRVTQRVKERLGRRVWNGKDIFIADRGEAGERVHVQRREWMGMVNFAPAKAKTLLATPTSRERQQPPHMVPWTGRPRK